MTAPVESHWAVVEADTITNVIVADTDFATAQGWRTTAEPTGSVALGAVRCSDSLLPGIGYTTANAGTTWTPPKPTATATARTEALTALQAMLPTLTPALEQAAADAAAYPTASPETQAAIVVRLIEGTTRVTEAVGYLLAHLGYVPATTQ